MSVIELRGCTAQPLLAYLKALGVLRLVAEQHDARVRGKWMTGIFALETSLDAEGLMRFFLYEYRPTPLIACWNGSSGFYPKDSKGAIEAIESSTSPRLDLYRRTIALARDVLKRLGVGEKPSNQAVKLQILRACRAEVPDEVVPWLDAAYVLTQDAARYPPILGTGGIDGHLEFTNNFMQRLVNVLPELGAKKDESKRWLSASLFGTPGVKLVLASVGQFHPGGVGGPNATQGFEGDSLVNPWDYVLGLEGTVLFAGGVGRRYTVEALPSNPRPAFPFTVLASAVGYGTASEAEYDGDMARAEIWLPEWTKWASYAEVSHLFSEGRAQWGGRQARTGADFARAVVGLGVDRGLSGFYRYGLLKRSGRAFLASPLGYFHVTDRSEVELLHDLDDWLESFRWSATRNEAPARVRRALQSIEQAIIDYAAAADGQVQRARALQAILVAVWEAESALAVSRQFRSRLGLRPFPGVGSRWWEHLDDASVECRLAFAVASLGAGDVFIGPIRVHFEPVALTDLGTFQWDDRSTRVIGEAPALPDRMALVLKRRVVEARALQMSHPPLDGAVPASLEDVSDFLSGPTSVDDARLARLIHAFSLIRWPKHVVPPKPDDQGHSLPLPPAYALLKVLCLPWPLRRDNLAPVVEEQQGAAAARSDTIDIKPDIAALTRLMSGDLEGACSVALMRLRAAGVEPAFGNAAELFVPADVMRRLAGALLIPVREVEKLVEMVRSKATELAKIQSGKGNAA